MKLALNKKGAKYTTKYKAPFSLISCRVALPKWLRRHRKHLCLYGSA